MMIDFSVIKVYLHLFFSLNFLLNQLSVILNAMVRCEKKNLRLKYPVFITFALMR